MENSLTAHASIEINATPAAVWEGLTNPEIVKQYFFGTDLVTDWQVGHPVFFRGEWEGKSYEDKGEVLIFEPEKHIQINYWSNLSGTEDIPEDYAVIDYNLSRTDTGTLVSIDQTGSKDETSRDHSASSWQGVLAGLKQLLEK